MYLVLSDPSTSPAVLVKQFDSDAAGPLILGRGSKSDASALDPSSPKFRTSATKVMSSMHAKVHWEGEYAFLTDLGATNGTFLVRDGDQQKLKPDVPYRLFSDDRIIFGRPVTQRNRGSSPIVSQPLTLVAKLQSSPVLVVQRKPDQVADSPRAALARGNTATEGSWRVNSYESSISDGEQAGSFEAVDDYESPRPKSSRRVSFAGLSRSSSIGDDDMRVGQHDVEMTSSPSSSKRGFGLSEEDLFSSREASPVEPTFAPGPLSELDELQLETMTSEDAVVETASVELMAIQSGSHSPMELDSDIARSPPATDLGAKLDKLVSTSLPSPVSPELQLVAVSPADEDPAQVDGDEHDMPRSTNPSQSKVGRTLVYSHDVDSSGDTSSSRPHEASVAPGPLGPLDRAESVKPSSPAQLSPALFANFEDTSASLPGYLAGSSRGWADKVAEHEDDDEDLLSQAASQLPSPSRSPEGFGMSTSEGIEVIEGSVEPLTKASRRQSPVSDDGDEGPEPPASSSPVSRRVATFLEELDDEDALVQAAECDAAALDIDADLDELPGPAAPAGVKAPGSPVSARLAAYVEELEEQHALVFEAEHTPDDIRVESFSDAAWSDRGEDDAREPMHWRPTTAALLNDDENGDDEDPDDEAAQSYEPCHIDPAAIASIARSPNLAAFISTILAGRGESLRPIFAGPAGEPVRPRDAAAPSSDEDLVDLCEGSAGSAEEDGSSKEEDMEDDDDDEMSEEDGNEQEEREADDMSEDEVSPSSKAVDTPTLPDATPADAPVPALARSIEPSPTRLYKLKREVRSASIVDSDLDLDEGDQDLDQVDLDLEADAFDEKSLEEHEIDHPDGFDEDGAEWEDGVSEKLVAAADQAEQLCTIEAASHALDKLSNSTASPSSISPSRKRRLSDTDLEAADQMPSLFEHSAAFDSSFPIGVAKSAQTDLSFSSAISTSTVAVGTEPAVVVAALPKRRRLDLPYKSFALGLVTGVVGAIAGLSALGSALESLE